MAVTHGLDPKVVREIAGRLTDAAHTVHEIGNEADHLVRALQWQGNDVGTLRAQWQSQGMRQFNEVAGQLEQAGKAVLAQVDQQDATSNNGGTGTPSAVDIFKGVLRASGDADDEGGFLDWLGDRAEDVWDGVTNVAEEVGDAVNGVVDTLEDARDWVVTTGLTVAGKALNWVGDIALKGLSWAADAVEWTTDVVGSVVSGAGDLLGGALDLMGLDALGSVVSGAFDYVGDGIESFGDAMPRVVDAAAGLLSAVADPMSQGRVPNVVEVLAAGTLVAGSAAGAFGNLVSGRDLHMFDDGHGSAGSPTPVEATSSMPESLPALVNSVIGAGEVKTPGEMNVRITAVTQADGTTAYVVAVPGTREWWPTTAGQSPMDLTGNLAAMSGQQSAAMEGVQAAMAEVIPEGAPVMMVGHSQGGIIASQLVSDPGFTDRYNVTDLMTYGSPVDTSAIPSDVNTLAVQHENDVVPKLDLGGLDFRGGRHPGGDSPSVHIVELDGPGTGLDHYNPVTQHDQYAYRNSLNSALESGNTDVIAFAAQTSEFYTSDPSKVTVVDVPITREVQDD